MQFSDVLKDTWARKAGIEPGIWLSEVDRSTFAPWALYECASISRNIIFLVCLSTYFIYVSLCEW